MSKTIEEIREQLEIFSYIRRDLANMADKDFLKLPVAAILRIAVAELKELTIPPQYLHEIDRRDRLIQKAERTIKQWEVEQAKRVPSLVNQLTGHIAAVWSKIAGEALHVLVVGKILCAFGSERAVKTLHERLANPEASVAHSERTGWRYLYPISSEANK